MFVLEKEGKEGKRGIPRKSSIYISTEMTFSLLSLVFPPLLNRHHFFTIKQSKSLEPVTVILSRIITFYLLANCNQPSQQQNAFQSSGRHIPLNSLDVDYLRSIGRDESKYHFSYRKQPPRCCLSRRAERHQYLRATILRLFRKYYFLPSRNYMFEHLCVRCLIAVCVP